MEGGKWGCAASRRITVALSARRPEHPLHLGPGVGFSRCRLRMERDEIYRAARLWVVIRIVNPLGNLRLRISSPIVVRHVDATVTRAIVYAHHRQSSAVVELAVVKHAVAVIADAKRVSRMADERRSLTVDRLAV